MHFSFTVEAEVERSEGKFASRDDLEGQLIEAIDGASPGNLEGEAGGNYEVTDWVVEAQAEAKANKIKKPAMSLPVQQPANIVEIIRAYVRLNAAIERDETILDEEGSQDLIVMMEVEEATKALTAALETLCDSFPMVTKHEKAQFKPA